MLSSLDRPQSSRPNAGAASPTTAAASSSFSNLVQPTTPTSQEKAANPPTAMSSAAELFTEQLKTEAEAERPSSSAVPVWVTHLAFSSFHAALRIRIKGNKQVEKSVMMAASYILVSAEAHINIRDSLITLLDRLPPESIKSVWVEVCSGFEQMAAIHFNIEEVDLFDELLLVSNELELYSCPDYIQVMEDGALSDPEPHSEKETLLQIDQPANLSIIDTPINTRHEYLIDKNVQQEHFDVEISFDAKYIHGTHVAGIAIQMDPKIQLHSFPAIGLTVLIDIHTKDKSHDDIEETYSDKGKLVSGVGKLSAALKDFLNSGTRVVNISADMHCPDERVIAFITPLMKSLREKGCIITIAAGN